MEDRHGRPRYRPEAMERLRRGFEVRVERRRRQQAPRIAYGQRLAAEQGLGRLGDVFRWNRKSRWWDPAAVVLILLALVTVFVGLPVGWKAGGTPLLVAIALLSAAVCVTLFVLLVRDPGRNDWIYSCDAGFVHVPHRALALLVVRWDQVVAIRRSWATTFSPSEEDYSPVPAGHVLLLEDGATLFLTRGYENVLDPWAGPMRGGFEAMRPVGQVLPRFPSLGDALERAVTGRLLPPATAAYERGEVVWFGPVGVGRQGIAVAPAQEALAWTEFGGLAQAGQALVLRKRSPGSGPAGPGAGRGSRPSALQDAVHNAGALMASAGLTIGGHSAGRRGTGQGDAWQVLDAGSVPNLCVLEAMLAQLQADGPQESGWSQPLRNTSAWRSGLHPRRRYPAWWESGVPMNLVMFGAPGSGKGTQCQLLWESRRLAHYSTGDMLRRHVAEGTTLGLAAGEIMSRGDLVPDGLMSDLVEDAITGPGAAAGFVLDGYPRTVAQAEALDAVLAATGRRLDAVISLKMPTSALVGRLAHRRVCPRCGRVYNLALTPGLTHCEDDCATLVRRPDDQPDAIRNRLDVYLRQTAPLLTFYGQRGQVIKIDGSRPVDQVRDHILRRLDALAGEGPGGPPGAGG